MTDSTPSPFRRFPRIQLVFCLACLSMAAWTWMRYSYAWDVTQKYFASQDADVCAHWLVERYACLRRASRDASAWRSYGNRQIHADPGGAIYVSVVRDEEPEDADIVKGRIAVKWTMTSRPMPYLALDASASRFHGASIAGLVVAAMGVFVFGLYLRKWVEERRAA